MAILQTKLGAEKGCQQMHSICVYGYLDETTVTLTSLRTSSVCLRASSNRVFQSISDLSKIVES
eukprot:1897826-Heterocapsa_arctica.AAC.1